MGDDWELIATRKRLPNGVHGINCRIDCETGTQTTRNTIQTQPPIRLVPMKILLINISLKRVVGGEGRGAFVLNKTP
jgi:hypothetical protein